MLSVVILHSQLIAPGLARMPFFSDFGWIGVRLFFVISGFIIAERIAFETSLPQFLLRRYLRVFPLYALATIIALATSVVTGSAIYSVSRTDSGAPFETDDRIFYILDSLLIIPQDRWPVLMVGWSLEYEVVFYAAFGCAFFFAKRKGALAIMFALAVVATLKPSISQPFFDSFFIYFLIGCLSREVVHLGLRYRASFAVAVCFVTGLLSILHLYEFLDLTAVGFVTATAFCFGAMIIAAVDLEQRTILFSGRSTLVLIGDMSFSIYLVHWLLIPVAGSLVENLQLTSIELEVFRLASLLAVLIVSWLVWRFVERPLNMACRRAVSAATLRTNYSERTFPKGLN